jgi:endo-1,4-beta-xylanase
MKISRRSFIAAGISAATVPSFAENRSAPDGSTLDRSTLDGLARAKGIRFGSVIGLADGDSSQADVRYWDLLKAQCSLVSPESALLWQVVHPAPEKYDFQHGDRLLAKASAAGLEMRGRTLLWNRKEYLGWVVDHDFGSQPVIASSFTLSGHIETVMRHYPGIRSWDVVSQTVDPETGALRQTPFTRYLEQETVDLAFHIARGVAPDAQLVYNDSMSWEPGSRKHRAGVLRMLARAKAHGVPINALGLQSHIAPASEAIGALVKAQSREWRTFLEHVSAMGVDILITELDCDDRRLRIDKTRRDQAVADYTGAYLDLTLSFPRVKSVQTRGLANLHPGLPSEDAPRAGEEFQQASLYDADFQPEPLREAVARAIRSMPAR